jgi:hypothetical protein
MHITAHEYVPLSFWGGLLAVIAFITFLFAGYQVLEIFANDKGKRQFAPFRVQMKSLTVFTILTFIFGSASGYLFWKQSTVRVVQVGEGLGTTIVVDEDQLRKWRGDEIGMNLVYSYIDETGTPVFRDFSNPAKSVHRRCPLIITERETTSDIVIFDREIGMKITPRCTNFTTDGENVPIVTPKPAPTPSAKSTTRK